MLDFGCSSTDQCSPLRHRQVLGITVLSCAQAAGIQSISSGRSRTHHPVLGWSRELDCCAGEDGTAAGSSREQLLGMSVATLRHQMSCPSDFMRIGAAIPLEVSTSVLSPPGAVSSSAFWQAARLYPGSCGAGMSAQGTRGNLDTVRHCTLCLLCRGHRGWLAQKAFWAMQTDALS